MKKKYYLFFITLMLMFGCASSPRTRRVDILTKLQQEIDQLKQNKADSRVQIEDIKTEIQVLSGKLEETAHSLKNLEEQLVKNNENMNRLMADYDQKIKSLEETHSKKQSSPEKTTVQESTFSLAEKHFSKKEYEEAILKYEEYKEKNPKGFKVSEAMYKQGLSFLALKKPADAKSFFEGIVSDFPKSPFAKKAKAELSKIK